MNDRNTMNTMVCSLNVPYIILTKWWMIYGWAKSEREKNNKRILVWETLAFQLFLLMLSLQWCRVRVFVEVLYYAFKNIIQNKLESINCNSFAVIQSALDSFCYAISNVLTNFTPAFYFKIQLLHSTTRCFQYKRLGHYKSIFHKFARKKNVYFFEKQRRNQWSK